MARGARDAASLPVGEVLDVQIEKGVYRGLGLARHRGQVLLVPRALPGDRLRVRVSSVRKGYAEASVQEVVTGGPGRRPSPCPYAGPCGGCAYQELEYRRQLGLKLEILGETLSRAGVVWAGEVPVAASPEEGWRSRCAFHVAGDGEGGLRVGLHREGSRRVVDIGHCLQLSPRMNAVLQALRGALTERAAVSRSVRAVDLAEGLEGRGLVVCLDGTFTAADASRLAGLGDAVPGVTGLGVMVAQEGRRRFVLLRGSPYVEAVVGGMRLRSHVRSFFQANRFLVDPLVSRVLEYLPPGGPVLDLYAGVGLFALPLAARGDPVTGIELSATAVEDALHNALDNRLERARFRRGDVLEILEAGPREAGERVVLDPPRSGAGPAVVAAVASRRPEAVAYVSCDPPTLARDLKLFDVAGYRIHALSALDLFPDTFHLESVALLRPGS